MNDIVVQFLLESVQKQTLNNHRKKREKQKTRRKPKELKLFQLRNKVEKKNCLHSFKVVTKIYGNKYFEARNQEEKLYCFVTLFGNLSVPSFFCTNGVWSVNCQ